MSTRQLDEEALFHAARALRDDERQAYLEQACADDRQLAERVRALLRIHDRARPMVGTAAVSALETRVAAPPQAPKQIGPYQLIAQIGEGGMGVVYVAEQLQPIRRHVALKIIKPGMDSRQVIDRFEAERQALAMMDHTNIAKILDAGTTEPTADALASRPYFVMELVRGVPLTDYCDQAQLPPRERLGLFVTLCQAVQHAHQKGIIHRDLKPSNVLVTLHDGQPVVKVIDFGVAKAIHQPLTPRAVHTAFAQMIGTPLYMSPEQAESSGLDIDTRSDIYSLGALLYELLTGENPIPRATLATASLDDLRRIIREDDPLPPSRRFGALDDQTRAAVARQRMLDERRLRHVLRGELDWIVMKALDKDRQRRYATAGDLAADIERFLHHLPIQARPGSPWLKLRKWGRRHPALASVAMAGVLLLVAAGGGAWWHQHQLAQAYAVSEHLREEGLKRENILMRELYSNDVRLAWQSAMLGDNPEARHLLGRYQPSSDREAPSFAWRYVSALAAEPRLMAAGHAADLLCADDSPDGRWVASGDREGHVKIWEVATGRPVHALHPSSKEMNSIRFSPDGQWLATAGQDCVVRLWQVGTWEEVARFSRHTKTVTAVAWSPDSRRLVSAGRDRYVHVWDAQEKKLLHTFPEQADVVRAVTWSADGRWVATANGNDGVLLWNTSDWSLQGKCSNNATRILAVAFSPAARWVAFAGYGGALSVFDVEKMEEVAVAETGENVWSLMFTGADELLVAQSSGRVQLRSVDLKDHVLRLEGEVRSNESCQRAAVVTRGNRLLTASEQDRLLLLHDFATAFGRDLRKLPETVVGVMRDRGLIVTTDEKTRTHLRRITDGSIVHSLPVVADRHCGAKLSPRGDLLVLLDDQKDLVLIDTATWQVRQRLASPNRIRNWGISADSAWVVAGCDQGVAGLWDTQSGTWRELFNRPGRHQACVAFAPVGDLLAVATMSGRGVQVWQASNQQLAASLVTTSVVNVLQFNNDASLLASGEAGGYISLWETKGYAKAAVLPNNAAVHLLAFSPGGQTLASADKSGAVKLWDLATRREYFSLVRDRPPDLAIEFASDQQLAVVTQAADELLLFHAHTAASTAADQPAESPAAQLPAP